jgi:hypothetical protein
VLLRASGVLISVWVQSIAIAQAHARASPVVVDGIQVEQERARVDHGVASEPDARLHRRIAQHTEYITRRNARCSVGVY